ncbi:MAG TPA: ROK family protein [Gaiellaceae bacterium]|nr:ROK family protein [Gaiellaceae bacterium]
MTVPASDPGGLAARPQLMRAMNEQLLLGQVRRAGPLSRADLVRLSGLSKPTVALALASLEQDELVQVAGRRTGSRGRAAALYEIRRDAGFVLGLDVGHEYVRGALADLAGVVRAKLTHRARSASARARVGELASLADELLRTAGVRRSRAILQTVVGSPGVLDPDRSALTMVGNLPGWERRAVVEEIRRGLGETTAIENDVDVAAVAERDYGHGRDVSTFAFVSVGTGIGMGLVIDGKLHRGAHGAAGEIAYLPLGPDGADVREVRRRGALEAAASSAAVVRSARTRGLGPHLSARSVFAAAAGGDAAAREVVGEEATLVAKALASVVAVVDPELIVLGGGIGCAPGFAAEVAARLERLAAFVPEIRVSALGEDAVVDGCLAAGMEQLWDRVLRSRGTEQRRPE